MDRRNPHKPFDRSLIEGFLHGRDILSVDLLTAGKNNSNYKLTLSGGDLCVLRLYSGGDAARETHAMGLVRELVPVPLELERGDGWSVFTFLEGERLESVPEHSGQAAEALARISSVSFDSQGWVNADGSVTPFSFGGHEGFTDEMLARSDVRGWIGEEAAEAIIAIEKREEPLHAEMAAESRLVHGDFNPTNILVHDGAVSGILDWEYCHSGTPYMDIGNLLRNTDQAYHGDIKLGLEASGMTLPEDWQERAELVDLGSHLEFLTSDRSDDFKRQCVARIEGFLAKFTNGG